MSSGDESEEKTRAVKSYPLNSKRLSAQVVRWIAVALGLPKASLADTRQMVEGSLSEDREPRNVQVDLVGSESGMIIRLRDADRVFLDIMPPDDPDEEEGSVGRGTGDQEVGEETEMETEVIEDNLRPRTGLHARRDGGRRGGVAERAGRCAGADCSTGDGKPTEH